MQGYMQKLFVDSIVVANKKNCRLDRLEGQNVEKKLCYC